MTFEPFRLERYFATREFSSPHNLAASDCEAMTVGSLADMVPGGREALLDTWLGYTESAGDPALRDDIAQLYRGLSRDNVLVHAGAEEAIFTFMHGTLAPGDQVIVHFPSYQSLSEIPRRLGCNVTYWRASHEGNWQLDLDQLEDLITPRCRLIVLNTPHNPTGYHMARDAFDRLVAIARQRGIVVFVDEVYRGLEPEARLRLPSIADEYEHGVSCNVMSKSYGLAGLRIGWIASQDTALLEKAALVKDYTTICSSAPSERIARLALSVGERLVDANRQLIRANLGSFQEVAARHVGTFSVVAPIAGPVAFPVLDSSIPVDRFCEDALREAGVLLLPGTVFDSTSNAFRVGLGRKAFPHAIQAFERFLSTVTQSR